MKANCYIVAWGKYAKGEAIWMACRKSPFSKLHGKMPWFLRWIGTVLVWSATAVWLLGHYFKFGTWPHWIYCEKIEGTCWEAVPKEGVKSARLCPPPLFEVKEQKFEDTE